MEDKKSNIVPILLFLALIVIGSLIVFVLFSKQFFSPKNTNNDGGQIACDMDAKLCPDGSYVGRSGPNCEFAACSTTEEVSTSTPVVEAYKYYQLSLQAFGSLSNYNFVHIAEWSKPMLNMFHTTFSCPTLTEDFHIYSEQIQKTMGDKVYCVSVSSEGAAGSVFKTYTYSTELNGELLSINFTAQFPQCLNYDNPQQGQCLIEQPKFEVDLDNVVATIVKSLKLDDDYKNSTYSSGATNFTFVNGVFEKGLVPNSAEKMTINYLSGYDLLGDFNGDGLQDVAFIATENDGGSGIFYSLYVYLSSPTGYVGSNNILLGDRIKPQSIGFADNKIVVNYFEHGPTQAMIDEPNTLVAKYVQVVDNEKLLEVNP